MRERVETYRVLCSGPTDGALDIFIYTLSFPSPFLLYFLTLLISFIVHLSQIKGAFFFLTCSLPCPWSQET